MYTEVEIAGEVDRQLLIKEQHESYENANICYIYTEKIKNKYVKNKTYRKARHHCHHAREYRSAAHSICNLK